MRGEYGRSDEIILMCCDEHCAMDWSIGRCQHLKEPPKVGYGQYFGHPFQLEEDQTCVGLSKRASFTNGPFPRFL